MKTKDLRIGNKIQDRNGFIFNVVGIGENWITTDFESNEGDVWEFNFKTNPPKPIELTEEILLKCGFEEAYKSDFTKTFRHENDKFSFKINISTGLSLWFLGVPIRCEYLHQMQNLYYFLCGKELEIEL